MSQERISVFDMFKIGVGPSSSHTLGPWRAALQFIESLKSEGTFDKVTSLQVLLYGSLAKTGKGHGTDIAILLGLCGEDPVTFDVEKIQETVDYIHQQKTLVLDGIQRLTFNPERDMIFFMDASLPYHPNAMTICATFSDGGTYAQTYYSVGGGFVEQEGKSGREAAKVKLPHPIDDAEELIDHCLENMMSIWEVVWENEKAWRPERETSLGLLNIWRVMSDCIYRGCHTTGMLPGGLEVVRRAARMNQEMIGKKPYNNFEEWLELIKQGDHSFQRVLNWVSCFALAVNEENASFGRVVTAPTNGAAGVIPSVLMYYIAFCDGNSPEKIIRFLLTAGEIGSIFKKGSTISAAMGGCQAEIGVSSAMAAGALTESLGGSVRQVLMASEIAMEHHLGLTCDPVGGLVQVPCIERNTMGAIKAITSAQLALQSDPEYAKVSLDHVIKTMWETALDMNAKYKETSDGGLAKHIPLNLSEC